MAERDEVLKWLLEPDNPPVRYLTLTNLLGKPARDREVQAAKAKLGNYEVTQAILARTDGFLDDDDDRAYWKYTGKYWQLIFLGQFLAGEDPRIARLAERILARTTWVSKAGGQCLTANILAALTRLGYDAHPVVEEQREALARRINAQGGIECTVMDYSLLHRCYMAQPKLLLCFAESPPEKRSPAIRAAIQLLVNNLLENEVFVYVPGNRKAWQRILERQPKAASLLKGQTVKEWVVRERQSFLAEQGFGEREAKAGWLKFGFPLHYNSDALEAMYALARLGVPYSPRMEKTLLAIEHKQTPGGRWILENSLNGKMLVDVETKGKPSKWLTCFARYVLQCYRRPAT